MGGNRAKMGNYKILIIREVFKKEYGNRVSFCMDVCVSERHMHRKRENFFCIIFSYCLYSILYCTYSIKHILEYCFVDGQMSLTKVK